jgi:hypothetical protein
MNGNHLGKAGVYIAKAKVHLGIITPVAPDTDPTYVGDARALNSTREPQVAGAATAFSYLTTDGSTDAPYLKAAP